MAWRDDAGVTCRCWNWRQCVRTRITGSTVSAMFILDGLAALGTDGLQTAGHDLARHLTGLHPQARLSWRQLGAVRPARPGPGGAYRLRAAARSGGRVVISTVV